MKKYLIAILLLLIFGVLFWIPGRYNAADIIESGSCGTNLTWTLDSEGTLTISGTGAMTEYSTNTSVPWYDYQRSIYSVIINRGVTTIGRHAFRTCQNLENVSLPTGLTSIGKWAFESCALTEVTIPNTVTSVEDWAFHNCTSLRSISLSSQMTVLSSHLFGGCRSLTSITIPTGVTSIAAEAFSGCSSLTEIVIPNNVLTIGNFVFSDCKNLTRVTIGNKVSSIGNYAFHQCESLASVTIPESVTSIGDEAFSYCSSLTEITIPSGVTELGDEIFMECSSLSAINVASGNANYSSVNGVLYDKNKTSLMCCPVKYTGALLIPDSVTSIEDSACRGCSNMTSVRIPVNLISIGYEAFMNCSGLTSVTIGNKVTSVKFGAFEDCTGLQSVTIGSSLGNSMFEGCINLTELILENGVVTIGSGAFRGCGITHVVLPDTVTSIESQAFMRCNELIEIRFSENITTIQYGAFSQCSKLTYLDIPSGIDLGSGAFRNCSSLTTVDIDSNPGEYMFSECNKLNTVRIGDHVTQIGSAAFYRCTDLTEISIPSGISEIGVQAFAGCSSLTNIMVDPGNPVFSSFAGALFNKDRTELLCCPGGFSVYEVPDQVEIIADYAFYECRNLKEIHISDSVTVIGDYAFHACSALKYINLPYSLNSIGESAFSSCSSLICIEIPDSVTSIGTEAFSNCNNMKSAIIPDSITSIGNYTFSRCQALTSVKMSGEITSVSSSAFRNCPNLKDVFYDGSRDEWDNLNVNIRNAVIFCEEDYDETYEVSIILAEVQGGYSVSMMSDGGRIYYTTDGSLPCSASLVYQGPFLLDESGEYLVQAVLLDTDSGTYGDLITDYVSIEQSEQPQIHEENGRIYITPVEHVYYSLDLTQEPALSSSLYREPIWLSATTVIKARTIEMGKAPSETVSYEFSVSGSGLSYPYDSYSFSNIAGSFGYSPLGYKISEARYTDIFGEAAGEFLYRIYGGGNWAGSCYGMSATSLMFSRGILQLDHYSDSANSVLQLSAPQFKTSVLTQLIERYQVAQFLPAMVQERNDVTSGGNMVISGLSSRETGDALLEAIYSSCIGETSIILILWRNGLDGCHAVVPYRLENNKIYIYDCNAPYEEGHPEKEHVITYEINENGNYSFYYGQYSYAISYNTLNTLLEGLEGLHTGQVSLSANGKEQMLISCNSDDFLILDEEGNEATDYSFLYATEDMTATEKALYIEKGQYSLINKDSNIDELILFAATEEEYHTLTVSDPSANVGIGVEYGHLYFTVNAEEAVQIKVHTFNTSGRENDIDITSDYAKIYACTEMAILIETKASAIIGNGEVIDLEKSAYDKKIYYGTVTKLVQESAHGWSPEQQQPVMCTDITELVGDGNDFSVNVQTNGTDQAILYLASYNRDGQMTDIRSIQTEPGRTKYPFTVSGEAAMVQVYLVDQETGVPLTEKLVID